jgi:hypothetical protein
MIVPVVLVVPPKLITRSNMIVQPKLITRSGAIVLGTFVHWSAIVSVM